MESDPIYERERKKADAIAKLAAWIAILSVLFCVHKEHWWTALWITLFFTLGTIVGSLVAEFDLDTFKRK